MVNINTLTDAQLETERLIEEQIKAHQKEFGFDIREYPISVLIEQFNPDNKKEPEIFIPEYQRDFVWTKKQQSLFIESLLIGIPIPYIFVADVDEKIENEGRLEVVDGSQRLRTIWDFCHHQLRLEGMERLTELEGKTIDDLPLSRQRRFLRTTIRIIELKSIDEDARRTMFDRLNSGSTLLTEMEKRRGVKDSKFLRLIERLSQDETFKRVLPMSKTKKKHKDDQEMVLRFLAYSHNYDNYNGKPREFLSDFVEQYKDLDDDKEQAFEREFKEMIDFVHQNFKFGFKKSEHAQSVPRVRSEAIAVGVIRALRKNPKLKDKKSMDTEWTYSDEFYQLVSADGANSVNKFKGRIEYVENKILEG